VRILYIILASILGGAAGWIVSSFIIQRCL